MKRSHRIAHGLLAAGVLLAIAPAASAASGELVLIPDLKTVVPLLIGFLLLIPIVDRIIVRPVFAVLDAREQKIEGARRRAESLEAHATEVLTRYQTSVREVRADSERLRREQLDAARSEQATITTRARDEAAHEIEQSRSELRASLEEARAELRTSAQELAQQAAERILGRPVS